MVLYIFRSCQEVLKKNNEKQNQRKKKTIVDAAISVFHQSRQKLQ